MQNTLFNRVDNKVVAEVVFDNGETVCFHAHWTEKGERQKVNRFTACSRERFDRVFIPA